MLSLIKKNKRIRKNSGENGKVSYKLICNTIYGKTLENLRNRVDVKCKMELPSIIGKLSFF